LKIGSIDPILITGAKNQGNDKMADTQQQMTGACLCGAVTYLVSGPMRNVVASMGKRFRIILRHRGCVGCLASRHSAIPLPCPGPVAQ
jgi:hypothetical protein